MLIATACLTSGVVYLGLKSWNQRRPRRKKKWLIALEQQPHTSPGQEVDDRKRNEKLSRHYLTVASVSLGLSVTGAIFYPVLGLVSIPLTVYGTLPVLEDAYAVLFHKARPKFSVIQASAMVLTLTTRHYIVAALIIWLHYYLAVVATQVRDFNNLLMLELEHTYRQFMAQMYGTKPNTVWIMTNGVGIEIPVEDLKVGDTVLVSASEVIPVEGTVVEGSAQVSQWRPTTSSRLEEKGPGDTVVPLSMVLTGKLNIRVDRL